jgi:hypothetical protein
VRAKVVEQAEMQTLCVRPVQKRNVDSRASGLTSSGRLDPCR